MNAVFIMFLMSFLLCVSGPASYGSERVDLGQTNSLKSINGNRPLKDLLNVDDLVLIEESTSNNKIYRRYIQTYKGIPVWGEHIIQVLSMDGVTVRLSGFLITGIEVDVPYVKPRIDESDAFSYILQRHQQQFTDQVFKDDWSKNELVIYRDEEGKARLAYKLSFATEAINGGAVHKLVYLIDASHGEMLLDFDSVASASDTCAGGPGGNPKIIGSGESYYGDHRCLEVNSIFGSCSDNENDLLEMTNDVIETFNEGECPEVDTCGQCDVHPPYGPWKFRRPANNCCRVGNAFSPLNDAHYNATKAIRRYRNRYDCNWPKLGGPKVQVFSGHGTNWANASWYMTRNSGIEFHQLFLGSGNNDYYPFSTRGVVAHETAHGFIMSNCDLLPSGQSGAISESFADLTGEDFEYELTASNDFKFGSNVTIDPDGYIRDISNPTSDGISIDNANDWIEGMSNHRAAGIYNKAMYTLATSEGWSLEKAYRTFLLAVDSYMTPSTNFSSGLHDLANAASDLNYDPAAVCEAFEMVGVDPGCSVPPQKVSFASQDTTSSANVVTWRYATTADADRFLVYRQTGIHQWDFIGSKDRTTETQYQLLDDSIAPLPGSYLYKIVAAKGACFSDPVHVTVTQPDTLTVHIVGPSWVDQFTESQWSASVSGGVGPLTYEWAIEDGVFGPDFDVSSIYEPSIWASLGSSTTIAVQVIDVNGRVGSDSKAITVTNPMTVSIYGPSSVLVNSSVYLTSAVAGGTPPYSYRWSQNGIVLLSSGSSISRRLFTSSTFELSVTDSNGRIVTRSKYISVYGSGGGDGGGGCPFVFVQNEDGFVKDNNLLLRSSFPENTAKPMTDRYKLQVQPAWSARGYRLRIQELNQDVSYFDQFRLYAVDHQVGTEIAVTQSGRVCQFDPAQGIQPRLSNSESGTLGRGPNGDVERRSGQSLNVEAELDPSKDWVLLVYGRPGLDSLIKYPDPDEEDPKIMAAQILGESGDAGTLALRETPSVTAIAVRDPRKFQMEFQWHRDSTVYDLRLVPVIWLDLDPLALPAPTAYRSNGERLTADLNETDLIYAELKPDEMIDLVFPSASGAPSRKMIRDFVLETRGFYLVPKHQKDGLRP